MNCCTIESETAADLMTLRAQLKTSEEAREKLRQRISELDDEIRAWGEKGRGGLIDLWRDQSIKNLKRAEAAECERDHLGKATQDLHEQISDLKAEVDSMQGHIDTLEGAASLDKNALRDANEKIARLQLSYEEHDKQWERLVDNREEKILILERLAEIGAPAPRIAKALALAKSAALSLQAPLAPASAQLLVDQLICVLQGEDP